MEFWWNVAVLSAIALHFQLGWLCATADNPTFVTYIEGCFRDHVTLPEHVTPSGDCEGNSRWHTKRDALGDAGCLQLPRLVLTVKASGALLQGGHHLIEYGRFQRIASGINSRLKNFFFLTLDRGCCRHRCPFSVNSRSWYLCLNYIILMLGQWDLDINSVLKCVCIWWCVIWKQLKICQRLR